MGAQQVWREEQAGPDPHEHSKVTGLRMLQLAHAYPASGKRQQSLGQPMHAAGVTTSMLPASGVGVDGGQAVRSRATGRHSRSNR